MKPDSLEAQIFALFKNKPRIVVNAKSPASALRKALQSGTSYPKLLAALDTLVADEKLEVHYHGDICTMIAKKRMVECAQCGIDPMTSEEIDVLQRRIDPDPVALRLVVNGATSDGRVDRDAAIKSIAAVPDVDTPSANENFSRLIAAGFIHPDSGSRKTFWLNLQRAEVVAAMPPPSTTNLTLVATTSVTTAPQPTIKQQRSLHVVTETASTVTAESDMPNEPVEKITWTITSLLGKVQRISEELRRLRETHSKELAAHAKTRYQRDKLSIENSALRAARDAADRSSESRKAELDKIIDGLVGLDKRVDILLSPVE